MVLSSENILFVGSMLLLLSIFAGKTSYKFGVPILLFFLLVGMLAGVEGIGKIKFDDPNLAQFIGIVALNIILFSGGLATKWEAVKPVLWEGVTLATLGVFITAVTVGVFVFYVTHLTFLESFLVGSIVSSTDAASVFSILRSNKLNLNYNLKPALELESGSNDPMAYFLTVTVIGLILNPTQSMWQIIPLFFQQFIIGAIFGVLFGYGGKFIINKIKLDYEGLSPILVLSLVFLCFSITSSFSGNGFLSVYVFAVVIGNKNYIHKKTIISFFDGLAWLMQIVLFLTLGLLVNPSNLIPIISIGLGITVFQIFFARPISVFVSLYFFKMKNKAKLFISWVGLRGAVPIVFATYPLIAGIKEAPLIFDIVYFISLISLLVQGTSLAFVSKLLGVSFDEETEMKALVSSKTDRYVNSIKSNHVEYYISSNSKVIGKQLVDIKLPDDVVIAVIKRDQQYIIPDGYTVINIHDILMVFSETTTNTEIRESFCAHDEE